MSSKAGFLVVAVVVLCVCGSSWGQKASRPDPADGATDVIQPLLRWTAGSTALFHDVYFGTTPDLGPEQLVAPRQVMTLYWHAPGVVAGTTYYWRVDEIEADGVTVHTGDVWTFLAQPLTAYLPDPPDEGNEAAVTPDLTWQVGQTAVQHHVYFSADKGAVTDGAADADKGIVAEPSFAPGELEPITTYYWRVDEIVPGDIVRTGAVWNFTTVLPVEGFESYTDDEGSRIYEAWIDGWVNDTGSTVGYVQAPFAEQTIVRGGTQSMPLDYNNLNAPYYSEAEKEFASAQDWTAGGTDTLLLYVQGRGVDFEIPNVSTPPVLDGEVDDVWAMASIQPVRTNIAGGPPTDEADASGQFRVLYDAENLYALVDVNDEQLHNDSGSAYLDDSVEFYVDGDNTKAGPGLVGNARQYTFGWSATDVQGTNTALTGVEHAQVDTPTGWRIEIKLPWRSLMSTDAPVGKLVGIDCFYNDDDDGGDTRESQIAWHSLVGNDWQTAASWGTALVVAPQSAASADLLYVALQDASNGVGVVANPDPQIMKATDWMPWRIPLADFTGVNLARITKMYIGVGDRANPVPGQTGIVYIDDISLTRPAPVGE